MQPEISVVVVSDYAAGEAKSWDDFRTCLRALAAQDFAGPSEVVICEWEGFRDQVPADLEGLLPGLRIVYCQGTTSYEMKNAGVAESRAPLVAILDADCTPVAGWMRAAIESFAARPSMSVVSGRSPYLGRNRMERLLALIDRTLEDGGKAGPTIHIATNNSVYRREVFLRHPFTLAAGPWGARLQMEAIRREGGELYFEPRMEAVHDHTGWPMVGDIRRNIGRAIVTTRLVDPLQPYAWVVRLRYAAIPIFVLGKTLKSIARCVLRHRDYQVRWFELPAAFGLAFVSHAMEVPGMIQAFRGQAISETKYR